MPARSVRMAAAATAIALTSSIGVAASAAGSTTGDGDAPPTLFGMTVQPSEGQSYQEALAAADRKFGFQEVIRYFDPDLPNSWGSIMDNTGHRPVVTSFNAPPREILSGTHDDALRQWFESAPKTQRLWWSYLPEPEEPSENGEFTPEQFRNAWAHIEDIADESAPRNLKSALVLMTYTLNPYSERNWRDYYPGDEHVDVMAWDGYNWAADDGRYARPHDQYRKAIRVARSVHKPWGIAETGSNLVESDEDGSGRAAWLRDLGRYAEKRDARFVTYFNSDNGGDYRLEDRPSQQAWRDVVDLASKSDGTSDSQGAPDGNGSDRGRNHDGYRKHAIGPTSAVDGSPGTGEVASSSTNVTDLVQRLLAFFRTWPQIF